MLPESTATFLGGRGEGKIIEINTLYSVTGIFFHFQIDDKFELISSKSEGNLIHLQEID